MSDYQDDEALARLRAADPATGAHPDLHRMSASLRGRTPLGSSRSGVGHDSGFSATGTSSTAVHVPDPGVHTRRSGLLVAASVAAVALGGGGYAVGAYTADGGGGGSTIASSTTDEGSAEDQEPGDAGDDGGIDLTAEGDSADRPLGDEDAVGGDAAMSSEGGGYLGPTIPVLGDGLSTERTTGPVHAVSVDSTGDAPELLRQYAEGLGLEGEITDDGSTMSSVTDSSDGRMLHVYSFAGLSIDYSNPALDSYCEQMVSDMAEGDMGWFGPGGPTDIECAPQGERPDDEQAIASVQEFLTQTGIDYSGLEFTVDSYGDVAFDMAEESERGSDPESVDPADGDTSEATAAPEGDSAPVDDSALETYLDQGMATEVSVTVTDPQSPVPGYRPWHFTVASAGVAYGSVQLGGYTELGDYEVISPAEAVERASDIRFQQMGAYIPDLEYSYPADDWVEPEPLPPVSPGEPIPYPLSESAVTSAELHTGVIGLWDGTEFLVPVYALSDGQGNYWEVLGLAEEALDFSP